jgi:hypothetical protein
LCFWPLEPAITSKNIYLGEDSPVLEELIASDVYPEELWYQNPRKGSWPWPMAEEDTSLSAWWWPLNASVTSVN